MKRILVLFIAFSIGASFFTIQNLAYAKRGSGGGSHSSGHRGHSGSHSSHSRSSSYYSGSYSSSSTAVAGVPRDSNGRIKRSSDAREDFMSATGYPHGRPGYVIDHIVPLKRGGADDPSNMQWQTIEDAKAKDKVE